MFWHIMVAIIRLCSYKDEPDDGHHDAPKHVVVASPIASYIIKLVVVLTVIDLFTLRYHSDIRL